MEAVGEGDFQYDQDCALMTKRRLNTRVCLSGLGQRSQGSLLGRRKGKLEKVEVSRSYWKSKILSCFSINDCSSNGSHFWHNLSIHQIGMNHNIEPPFSGTACSFAKVFIPILGGGACEHVHTCYQSCNSNNTQQLPVCRGFQNLNLMFSFLLDSW